MASASYRPARIPALLFWQVCLLAAMMGLFATRFLYPALAMFCLLTMADWPRCCTFKRLGVLAFCMLAGFVYAASFFPQPPQTPAWITGKAQRISARVAEVTGLPDQRLRILLEDVRLANDEATSEKKNNASPLPTSTASNTTSQVPATEPIHGSVVWTWEAPTFRPMTGQRLEATLFIRPVRGFRTGSGFDLEMFWRLQNVWFRSWSKGDTSKIAIVHHATIPAQGREWLRERIVSRLAFLEGNKNLSNYLADTSQSTIHKDTLPPSTSLSPASSIIVGILFGDRFYMDSHMVDLFIRTDLLHSLALSGQHLAVAGILAALCITIISRTSPTAFLSIPRPRLFLFLCLPPAAFYLWLGNAPPSLIRASLMLLFWSLLFLTRRPGTLLDALLWALLCILLVHPLDIFDLGLQLSSLAIVAIACTLPLYERITASPQQPHYTTGRQTKVSRKTTRSTVTRILQAVFFIALTSTAIQCVLLPLQLMTFGKASPWFLLNIFWMPLADLIVLPLSFVALLCQMIPILTPLGDAALFIARLPCEGLLFLLQTLEHMKLLHLFAILRPHWLSALGYGALLLCLVSHFGRRTTPHTVRILFPVALILFYSGAITRTVEGHSKETRLSVIDVGQGQALLLRTENNQRFLIDGGGFRSSRFDSGRDLLAPILTKNAPPHIDMVFTTHPDYDHQRGLIHIIKAFSVQQVADNGDNTPKRITLQMQQALLDANLTATPLLAGMKIQLGAQTILEVLHPQSHTHDAGNNGSLVMRLVHNGKGLALLCGDIEKEGLRTILASKQNIQAEVLVLPHHGSSSSYLSAFYDAVNPRIAIASCGYQNRYRYPNKPVREALAQRNVTLFTTAQHGTISLEWNNNQTKPQVHWARKAQAPIDSHILHYIPWL